MNLLEAMEQRHAIRAYPDEPVDQAIQDILRAADGWGAAARRTVPCRTAL